MHLIQEKWTDILNMIKIEHQLSDVSFKTWLEPLTVHKVEGNTVTVVVPTGQIGINYIRNKYLLPLNVAVSEATGKEYDIALIEPKDIPPETVQAPVSSITINENIEKANLNPRYTFDTFVVGSNNKMAHAASVAVAESPGEAYNPLFIYGGVGLGKTHLMHSIAHYVLEKNSEAKVLYVTSELFTNELIESIRNGNNSTMTKFREKYRNIDVLLIDDIQFIIGKESTQEEFFHTFNTLHGAKKQIIISSDKPPKDMEILEDRLRSRFEWGLIVDISAPDFETRMAILKKKEELDGYYIDDEVIEYIAQNVKSNIRELEGSLNKIMAYANLENKEINLALAEKVLKDIISPNQKRTITPELIINTVAEHFDLTTADLIGNKRSSKIAYPRQIAMYLCRHMTDTTLKIIGDSLGGRDHTTIMSGIRRIEKEVDTSDETREIINILKKKINPTK
ncbi:MAG: chromosomal replication initiator protein DnaA [Bacillus sp. (in: firmicutes)]